jgi:transposase-like protein
MQDEQRRKFTPDQKFKIVKEALTTDTTIADVCKKYDVVVSQFYRWQDAFFEGALNGLERKKSGPVSTSEQRKIEQLEKDNLRMKDVIAEIASENITIKKRIGE